mgnify:CR=1 FL=1
MPCVTVKLKSPLLLLLLSLSLSKPKPKPDLVEVDQLAMRMQPARCDATVSEANPLRVGIHLS